MNDPEKERVLTYLAGQPRGKTWKDSVVRMKAAAAHAQRQVSRILGDHHAHAQEACLARRHRGHEADRDGLRDAIP